MIEKTVIIGENMYIVRTMTLAEEQERIQLNIANSGQAIRNRVLAWEDEQRQIKRAIRERIE